MKPNTHLPDELSDWPVSPHHVLGVSDEADRRTIRRAYARLLRIYRPDEFPEQFNRILEARDYLVRAAEYRASSIEQKSNESEWLTEVSSIDDISRLQSIPKLIEQPVPTDRLATDLAVDNTIDSAWQKAINGETKRAYEELCTLVDRDRLAAVRLYWLERLFPALNGSKDRRPVDWLLDNSSQLPLDLLFRLLSECAANNEQIWADERLRKLIESHGTESLFFFVQRWQFAAKAGIANVIEEDLQVASRTITVLLEPWLLLAAWATALNENDAFQKLLLNCLEDLRQADWNRAWVPTGPAEDVFEQAIERRDVSKRGRDNATERWLRDLLLNAPIHPVLEKAYWEERLNIWWSTADITMVKLDRAASEVPLLLDRFQRRLSDHSQYDHHRVIAASVTARAELERRRRYDRETIASICRTFLVPSEWIVMQLVRSEESYRKLDQTAMFVLQNDLALHALTLGWCVYAVTPAVDTHFDSESEAYR